MPVHLQDLESAFLTIHGDPLGRAWIHRTTGDIWFVSPFMDDNEPPSERDHEWVELPTADALDLTHALVEAFVREHCTHLALPASQCLAHPHFWRSFTGLLDTNGYLEDWHRFRAKARHEALRAWAQQHTIAVLTA